MPLLRAETEIFPETMLDSSDVWWVAHVRSRHEKMLARQFLQRGIPFYLPQIEKTTIRASRRFVSFVPLFPGYVFFRGGAGARTFAERSDAVAGVIPVEDQDLLTDELRQIRRLQLAGASLQPVEEIASGDAVRITDGAFAGYHGTVVRTTRGDRLLVAVSLLRKVVAVEFARGTLKRRRA
jgi:transcription antitermination factor NusG